MIQANIDFIVTWTWDKYHILAVVAGLFFAFGFIYIVHDSIKKNKK